MNRAALLAVALLTFAACSSDGDAEPPPPLDTEAPTTTVEPPPTTETADTTTSSTTTTTTTVPDTTSTAATATTVAEPSTTTAESQPIDSVVVLDDAYAAYEIAWATRRAAIRNPTDIDLRAAVNDLYVDNERLASVNEFLDARADAADQILEDPASPSSLEFLEGVFVTDDGGIAQFLVCETLRDDVVDAEGTTTFSENISYRNQVIMELGSRNWRVQLESTDEEFVSAETCS